MSEYYVRNESDQKLDTEIRDTIKKSKSKSHMALYLQGQEELNLLRKMVDNQEEFRQDFATLQQMIEKQDVINEEYDNNLNLYELQLMIYNKLNDLEKMLSDLMLYLCESEDKGAFAEKAEEYNKIKEQAERYARIEAIKAKSMTAVPHALKVSLMDIWDYIMTCMADE